MIISLSNQILPRIWRNKWAWIAASSGLAGCLALRLIRTLRTQPQFEYEALKDSTSHIRLLTILPSPNYGAVIVCELVAVRLDEAPRYEALSYHWGHGIQDQPLIVNGGRKLVTNSLLRALKDLRRPFRPRIVWADGLCINQAEDAVEERNAQLFQMQRVFSQASVAMARLSDADLDFWNLFSLFEMTHALKDVEPGAVKRAAELRMAGEIIKLEAVLSKFAVLPWWRRVWVFQEVIVAKELTLFCGIAEIPWTSLRMAAWLCGGVYGKRTGSRPYAWAMHISRMTHLREEYKGRRQLSLVDLLSTVRGPAYGVTNPKDRVLALLGLAEERDEISRTYQPDYKQTLAEIYCSISRLAIQISGSTKILSYAGSNSGLPSWTPDWRIGSSREDWDRLHTTLDSLTGILFGASAVSKSILCEKQTPADVLKLKGVLFDTVQHRHHVQTRTLHSVWQYIQKQRRLFPSTKYDESFFPEEVKHEIEDFFSEDDKQEIEKSWLTMAINQDIRDETSAGRNIRDNACGGVPRNYSCTEFQDDDPMLTMLLAMNGLWSDEKGMLRRTNKNLLESLRKFLLQEGASDDQFCGDLERYDLGHGSNGLQNDTSQPNADTALSIDTLQNLYETAKQKNAKQQIGRTSRGYLLTSPHWELEKGDMICIFLGGSVPYVLRPRDNHYILIGEVYVHGIMDGEAMKAVARQELELEWITLK